MKPLLQTSDPKYRKRLVRALNSQEHGFYTSVGIRCNRARINNGVFQIKRIAGKWEGSDVMSFCDAYGREIVASRS